MEEAAIEEMAEAPACDDMMDASGNVDMEGFDAGDMEACETEGLYASGGDAEAHDDQASPKKKPVGSFPVFFEKHIHQVKLKQPDWSDNQIEEFLKGQWQDMSEHQKSCYMPENSDDVWIGEAKAADAIKKFNSILNTLVHKKYPVIGLDYISVHKTATNDAGPSYRCGLCDIIFDLSSVAPHVLGTKHRLGYLKTVNHSRFRQIIQIMKRKRTPKQHIVRLLIGETKRWESKLGRGEIKASRKDTPAVHSSNTVAVPSRNSIASKKMRTNPRNTFNQMAPRSGGLLPLNAPYQEPYFQSMAPFQKPYPQNVPNYNNLHVYKRMPPMKKLRMIQELANSLISTEREARVARDILGAISKKMFQFQAQHMPPAARDNSNARGGVRPRYNVQRNPPSKGRKYASESRASHGSSQGKPARPLLPNPTTYSIRDVQTSQSEAAAKEDPFLIGGYSAEYKF